MQQPNIVSRLADWLSLFARWPSWIALAGFIALALAGNFAASAILASASGPAAASITPKIFALSFARYVAWTLLVLFLARRFGGDGPRTDIVMVLLAAVAFCFLGLMVPSFAGGFLAGMAGVPPDMAQLTLSGISLIWGIAVLPLPVWLVASAHAGRTIGVQAIGTYLAGRGIGLWLLFAGFQSASLALWFGVSELLGSGVETYGSLLLRQSVEGFRTTALVLFYIMIYHEIRMANGQPDLADVFE